jgi:hypothetical protein
MISPHNEWQIQTNLDATVSSKAVSVLLNGKRFVASMLLQALQEPKPVKQCESNERERDGKNLVA